ncbi:nitrogen fixation protein NifM [Psychromonas sp. KJ10-10]|uniref:nitrogen fixation protein NifM n=1 Tax=Psychromonas sp. KJ10-10 TaxID=3391823 RepID=UPI0039B64C01
MSFSVSENISVNFQYQLIKLAWAQYQTSPESVDASCLAKLTQQAKGAQKIIMAVLSSEVAKDHSVITEEIDFVFEQLVSQFEHPENFRLSLKAQKLTEKDLQQAIYQDLLCEKIIDAQSQNYRVATTQEALDYYENNKQQFMHPEHRHVSHILITINDEYTENQKGNALSRINTLRAKLVNKPDTFAKQALTHSECPTALNNGVVGTVSRGQLYPELDNVLFAMQPGKISSVVESEIGYHLLYCHEIYPAFESPKEEALTEITKQLNQHRKSKCEKKWLSSLLLANHA